MRLIGIGLATVLALVTMSTASYSADKAPPGVDPKARAQGMKEAPAALQAIGLKCTMTDARFIGGAKDPKTKVATNYYEIACQEGMGYVISSSTDNSPGAHVDCLAAANPTADGKPSSITCKLPANADPKQALVPLIAKGGRACALTKARGIGATPKNAFFEVACADGSGYILETSSPPDASQDVVMSSCLEFEPGNQLECKLSDRAAMLKVADTLIGQANKGCEVKDRRYVLATKSGSQYFEVSCTDGKGWMIEQTANGSLGRTIDCATAENVIQGGCTLTDSRAAQTEQAGLYSRLAKKVGYDCAVEKYAPLPSHENAEEVVELKCSNRPDGAIAVFKGAGGTVYDCAHSELVGYRCSFSHADAALPGLTKDLNSLGKTTCQVSNTRAIGSTSDKKGYIEVACSDGNPGWVIEYSPEMKPLSVMTCGQASGIGGGCKLPGNVKK